MKAVTAIKYVCEKCGREFNSEKHCAEHEKRHGEILFINPVFGEYFVGAKEINLFCKFDEKIYKMNYKYAGIGEVTKDELKLCINSLYGKQVMKDDTY